MQKLFKFHDSIASPEFQYAYEKDEINRRLQKLEFSKWINVGSEDGYFLPEDEGVSISYNENTQVSVGSYSNDIKRRFKELPKEPNTIGMTHFCFALVDNHDDRITYRRLLNNKFAAIELDKLGIVPIPTTKIHT